MSDERLLAVMTEIRNWIRAASHGAVKDLLEAALPTEKDRRVYQMLDGTKSAEAVRTACKVSPNDVVALTRRCISMGLMEVNEEKKRVRLFDLADFGLFGAGESGEKS
jgi:hypothetical protein